MKARTVKTVASLRQSGVVFRALGVLALALSVIAGLVMAGDSPESVAGTNSAVATGLVLVVYGIAGAIGCFAISAVFDGLATITELLALK